MSGERILIAHPAADLYGSDLQLVETVDSPWTYSLRMRLPWLILNVLN